MILIKVSCYFHSVHKYYLCVPIFLKRTFWLISFLWSTALKQIHLESFCQTLLHNLISHQKKKKKQLLALSYLCFTCFPTTACGGADWDPPAVYVPMEKSTVWSSSFRKDNKMRIFWNSRHSSSACRKLL